MAIILAPPGRLAGVIRRIGPAALFWGVILVAISIKQTSTSTGSFVVPAGVFAIRIAAWGQGGDGTTSLGAAGEKGGGGGAFAWGDFACTPTETWNVTIAGGQASVSNPSLSTVIVAVPATGQAGGLASGCTGTITFNGGDGGNGGVTVGGGGGGTGSVNGAGGAGVDGDSGGQGGLASDGGTNAPSGGTGGAAPGAAGGVPGAGGAGGNKTGTQTGGLGSGAEVIFYTIIGDPPSVQTAHQSPPIRDIEVPKFPGGVIFGRAPYGVPVPAIASGELSQFRVETLSPPPFPGSVLTVTNRAPIQPPSESMVNPPPIQTASPPPFPGGVFAGSLNRFGIAAVATPPRITRIETQSPPPFPGGVIVGRPRAHEGRDVLPAPIVVRMSDLPSEVRQPTSTSGTHERPAVGPMSRVIAGDTPPVFAGHVFAFRGVGPGPLPAKPTVVRVEPVVGEPGRVIASGGRVQIPRAGQPFVASLPPAQPDLLRQPIFSSGTPAPRVNVSASVIREAQPVPVFSGQVVIGRASGLSPLPARPVVARLTEVPPAPGSVIFSHATPTDPIRRRTTVVAEILPATPFPGAVYTSSESSLTAKPVISRPSPMIVSNNLWRFAEVIQPVFGWGSPRIGSGAPPDPLVGVVITIQGIDQTSLTICSIDTCECE